MAAGLQAQMLHWLVQVGVRPELLVRTSQAISDEVRHSALCQRLYSQLGGPPSAIPIAADQLAHKDDADQETGWRALTAAAEMACEESVAVAVFKARLANATHPAVQELCRMILQDEAVHRGLAWDLLEELKSLLGPDAAKAYAQPRVGFWLRNYTEAFLEAAPIVYTEDQLGLGLVQREEHWMLMRDCAVEDVLPRFERLGFVAPGTTLADLRHQSSLWRSTLTIKEGFHDEA